MQSSIDPYLTSFRKWVPGVRATVCVCGVNIGFGIRYQYKSNYIFNLLFGVWFMVYMVMDVRMSFI